MHDGTQIPFKRHAAETEVLRELPFHASRVGTGLPLAPVALKQTDHQGSRCRDVNTDGNPYRTGTISRRGLAPVVDVFELNRHVCKPVCQQAWIESSNESQRVA